MAIALTALAGGAAPPAALADGTMEVRIAGAGRVTGLGINCERPVGGATTGTCSRLVRDECIPGLPKPICLPAVITLTADDLAGTGFGFDHWSGACSGSERACALSMTTERSATANFHDIEWPSVALMEPAAGVRAGTIALGATANDNAGVAKVVFSVGGVARATDTSPPYAASYDTHGVRDGAAAVSATAYDVAGHTSSRTTTITVDNTAPSLDVTGPDHQAFGPGATQHWSLVASDTTAGIQSVTCSVVPSGAPPHFAPCTEGAAGHTVSGEPEGAYTLTVRAIDGAGNTHDVRRTFSVDATAPDTRITSGAGDGATVTSTSLAWTFESTEAGSSFRCRVYPAALTPGSFGLCTSSSGHAATGFAPGTYAFEVMATDAVGNIDSTAAKRTFTVAAPPAAPVPVPASPAGSAPGSAGSVLSAGARQLLVTLAYRYRSTHTRTHLTRLLVKHVPRGSTVTAKCPHGCARKSYRKRHAHGTVSLKPLIRRSMKPKTKITVTVSHSGATTAIKTLEIRKRHSPRVRTYCRPPGAKHASKC